MHTRFSTICIYSKKKLSGAICESLIIVPWCRMSCAHNSFICTDGRTDMSKSTCCILCVWGIIKVCANFYTAIVDIGD